MAIVTKIPITVQVNGNNHSCTYTHHPQHRDKTPTKSQWAISYDEESQSFSLSLQNQWKDDINGWGIYLANGKADFLGISHDRNHNLLVAKYVHDVIHNDWHGYPANHITYERDKPPDAILLDWVSKNYIASSKMRKILKGQPCNL